MPRQKGGARTKQESKTREAESAGTEEKEGDKAAREVVSTTGRREAKATRADAHAKGAGDEDTTSKKRKSAAEDETLQKAQRRSGRDASKTKPKQEQLLAFLLSQDAEDLVRPDDEAEDVKKLGQIKTYSSGVFNPFEELMCAIILSRPISHRLGLRTIRTVLNDPYDFTSAQAVREAGSEKQRQALWDARTQHKEKTASQLGQIAEVVLDKYTASSDKQGSELGKLLEECGGDVEKIRSTLKEEVKGLGKTGLDIFFRRVQWLWEAIFPFVDARTQDSLRKVDLPSDAGGLEKAINEHWKQLDVGHLAGDSETQRKRRAFVIVLERAIGADLEGKIETMISGAAH